MVVRAKARQVLVIITAAHVMGDDVIDFFREVDAAAPGLSIRRRAAPSIAF